MADSKFEALVKKLMRTQGLNEQDARELAYWIGKQKYGKAGMAKKAAAGRKK